MLFSSSLRAIIIQSFSLTQGLLQLGWDGGAADPTSLPLHAMVHLSVLIMPQAPRGHIHAPL